MSTLDQAISVVAAVQDSDLTSDKVSSAIQTAGLEKDMVVKKILKLSSAVSSIGGRTRKRRGKQSKKTRKH